MVLTHALFMIPLLFAIIFMSANLIGKIGDSIVDIATGKDGKKVDKDIPEWLDSEAQYLHPSSREYLNQFSER